MQGKIYALLTFKLLIIHTHPIIIKTITLLTESNYPTHSNVSISKLVSNVTRLVVVLVGSVVVPEEVKVLRVRGRVVTSLIVLRSLVDDSRELGERARVTGSALALGVRNNSLIEDGTDVDTGLAHSGSVASHTLQSKVTTHGHDISHAVGVREGDGAVGELVLGNVDIQGGNDGGNIGIVGTGWLLEQQFEVG